MHSHRQIQKGSSKQIKSSLRDKLESVQVAVHSVFHVTGILSTNTFLYLPMELQNDLTRLVFSFYQW